jgi:hypothetical protein
MVQRLYEMDWTLHLAMNLPPIPTMLTPGSVAEPEQACGCQSGLDEEKAWKRQEIRQSLPESDAGNNTAPIGISHFNIRGHFSVEVEE